jgi:hypothetical protein
LLTVKNTLVNLKKEFEPAEECTSLPMATDIPAISKMVYEQVRVRIPLPMEENGKVFGDKMNLSVLINLGQVLFENNRSLI